MAAATYIGGVGSYDNSKETFEANTKRLEMFFLANSIVELPGDEEAAVAARAVVELRKKAIFLSEVGPEVYAVLSNLVAPNKPKDKTLADIFVSLKGHYNPALLEISESFHFGKRDQKSGETVNDYILALKKLSIHCNFGEYLNRALRDRLVCGL
jgi:hypothetical protein